MQKFEIYKLATKQILFNSFQWVCCVRVFPPKILSQLSDRCIMYKNVCVHSRAEVLS